MNCNECAHKNRPQARFCEQCGNPLAVVCSHCATELRPNARYCDTCGAPVNAVLPETRIEKLRNATPKKIIDAIQRDHAQMEGERRVVTVLFADAVGHTAIAESLDPEDLYALMQGCFERMQKAVHLYEGTVNQFTGDGILALFGAPIAHEDSARRAVAAALEMQRQLAEYASSVKEKYPVQCNYRVGLNTGPVVVGRISEGLDLEFAAIGDTVNLAARVESMADSGAVYITENTYRAVEAFFDFEDLGKHDVKGLSAPVQIYRPIREKTLRRRFEAVAHRGLTTYVGRDEERKLLAGYLDRTTPRQGQIVLVSGDAGLGKSRLLLEFKNNTNLNNTTWLEGQCASYGRLTSYLPFIDIVKQALGIGETDTEADMQEKANEAFAKWTEEHRKLAPFLKCLLQIAPCDAAVEAMDPVERKTNTIEALRAFVVEHSAHKRLVILIEDLHWCDDQSMQALIALFDVVARSQVFLVITSRPGHRLPPIERSYFSRLALTNLPNDQSASVIVAVLGTDQLPNDLIKLIAGKAEGNPFYIEEVAKSLIETGALERRNGGYALNKSIESVHIPDTIHEVILARMDRLDRDARGAMQVASVIGREFTVRILDRIADIRAELGSLLDDLKTLELIYESRFAPELSYMFKHALTHDVAYSTLLVERRRALHRMVAAAIEEIYADRLAEHFEALAHHYEEANHWEKALDYLDKAGDKARNAYANQSALSFYGRALDVCGRLGKSAYRRAVLIAEKRVWIYFLVSEYTPGIKQIEWILAMARRRKDPVLETNTLNLKGFFETYAHDFENGEASINEAIALATRNKLDDHLANGRTMRYFLYKVTNRHAEAQDDRKYIEDNETKLNDPNAIGHYYFTSALDKAWKGQYVDGLQQARRWREQPVQPPYIMVYHLRWCESLLAAGCGQYSVAIRELQTVERDCERMGEIALRARVLNTLGWIHGILQDHGRAIELNEQGIEVALMEGDEPEKLHNARLNCADILIAQGRHAEAQKHLERVEQTVRHPKPEERWMLWRFSQHYYSTAAKLQLAEGNCDAALALADECLPLAIKSESTKYIVQSHRLRGEAFMALKDKATAQREFDAASAAARRLQNPAESWMTFVSVGQFLRAGGDASAAHRASDSAIRTIGEIAKSLDDEALRNTLLQSAAVRAASK